MPKGTATPAVYSVLFTNGSPATLEDWLAPGSPRGQDSNLLHLHARRRNSPESFVGERKRSP
jgi:hypothetical protein